MFVQSLCFVVMLVMVDGGLPGKMPDPPAMPDGPPSGMDEIPSGPPDGISEMSAGSPDGLPEMPDGAPHDIPKMDSIPGAT